MTARAAVMQGIALLAVVAAGAGAIVRSGHAPMDSGELKVAVEQLRAQAVETRALLEQERTGSLSHLFVHEHAAQLHKRVSASRDSLRDRTAQPPVDGRRVAAADAATRLAELLAAVARRVPQGDPSAELERLQHAFDALERDLTAQAQ